uniref:Uncharacterized protein n=1 Tax=Loa loa TaxID=7209 RepID=A0A1I7V7N8_LOALO
MLTILSSMLTLKDVTIGVTGVKLSDVNIFDVNNVIGDVKTVEDTTIGLVEDAYHLSDLIDHLNFDRQCDGFVCLPKQISTAHFLLLDLE